MLTRNELIKLYGENKMEEIFKINCESCIKFDDDNRLELNFGKKNLNESHIYGYITYITFKKDNTVVVGKRRSYEYSKKYIERFKDTFGSDNLKCSRDGIIINVKNENYSDFFKKLTSILRTFEFSENLLNKKNESLVNVKKLLDLPINLIKNNYYINKFFISNNDTIVLKINYSGNNKEIDFFETMSQIRNLNEINKQDGNTIEFKQGISLMEIIRLLTNLNWKIS